MNDKILDAFGNEMYFLRKMETDTYEIYKAGYKAATSTMEKEIKALKDENEKMHCCGNCGNYGPLQVHDNENDGCILNNTAFSGNYVCDKWEPKQ